MTMTRTPDTLCPYCGYLLSASVGREDHVPQEGDLSLCYSCGGILTYDKDLLQKKITDEILGTMSEEAFQELYLARKVVLEDITKRKIENLLHSLPTQNPIIILC